jgi:hypothetical protein
MRLLWSEHKGVTLAVLRQLLRSSSRRFGDVTMADLVAPEATQSTGLYFFWSADHDEIAYVGMAKSRAFIERVPSHLDVRPDAWFATLLERLQENEKLPQRASAVPHALALKLSLLAADYAGIDLQNAETELRHAFRPRLNLPRTPRHVNCAKVTLDEIS